MTTTTIINHRLTKQQLTILSLLYRFRHGTSDLFAKSTNSNKRTINIRLKLMLEQKYIGRNYESSYKLIGKHASYYLLPKGIKTLKQLNDQSKYSPTVLRNIGRDKDASEGFIKHCLDIFSVYCSLKAQHGDKLQFFTKSQLTSYAHFPQPLPDAYLRLSHDKGKTQFFMSILNEHPFFLSSRKVIQYTVYAERQKEEWQEMTSTILPSVLLVCENESLQKRLTKKMRRAMQDVEDEMQLYATTLNAFQQNSTWQSMTNNEEVLPLNDIL